MEFSTCSYIIVHSKKQLVGWVKFVFSRVFSEMCKRGLLRHNFQCKRKESRRRSGVRRFLAEWYSYRKCVWWPFRTER